MGAEYVLVAEDSVVGDEGERLGRSLTLDERAAMMMTSGAVVQE